MTSTVHIPLGILDHFCPPNYTAVGWYIPLKHGITPQEAFSALQDGLRLTFKQLPWLSGKVYKQAPETPGWRPGQLEIRYEPADLEDDSAPLPQFRFKQLDEEVSYDEIKECGFPINMFPDAEVLWGEYINVPGLDHGAECLKAQANFLPGAVFLTGATHHNVSDGTGQFDIWRAWAANCHALQSGAVPAEPDPLSSDRNLIERIWASEGPGGADSARRDEDMQPVSWTLLDMDPPNAPKKAAQPPPVSLDETMESAIFYMSPDSFTALHKRCVQEAGPAAGISGNDALTALIWRGLLKARRRAAALKAGRGGPDPDDDYDGHVQARLQLALDGRPDISRRGAVPLVWLGNLVFMNECALPLAELTAPGPTAVSAVARAIRAAAAAATPDAMLDAYALARRADDLARLGLRLTPLRGGDGDGDAAYYDMIASSLLMFPVDEMRWGERAFARDGGRPEALRPLWEAINAAARLCFPLPRRSGAGVEFAVNLFPDEMELLLEDEEFGEYAVQM